MGSDTEDALSEGGFDGENSRTYYFGSSTITVDKIKEMVEKGYLPKGKAWYQGLKLCQSRAMMKPLYLRTFLLLVCGCLCIQPWRIFYYISRLSCIS
jgi:hypothetical protein